MKPFLLAILCVIPMLLTLPAGARLVRSSETLALIEDLDKVIQRRLSDPEPAVFGMSRMIRPYSMGEHFAPVTRDGRDFVPGNDTERTVIAALEARKLQVGLYLFGEAILRDDASKLNYRALKGPGAITANTPRPGWYPSQHQRALTADLGDTLSDWAKIYPVAQRAMRSFKDGGKGFELQFEGWTVAARPAIASDDRCVACHANRGVGGSPSLKRGEALGGVLYAFRLPKATTARIP